MRIILFGSKENFVTSKVFSSQANIIECEEITVIRDNKEILCAASCCVPRNSLTFLVGENGTGAEGQQNHFRAQILQQRITRLASGIAIIRVGAATEVEMIEKKHRIEDALEAVRSAQQEGIVAGGGVALLRAAEGLNVEVANEDQRLGVELLKIVAAEPLRQMADNAGESPDIVVSMVSKETENYGYDFTTQKLEDMYQIGVVDPVKVTRCALQNAVSVASTLITTNHAIIQV